MNKQRLLARLATFYLVSCKSANSEKADPMAIPQTDIPASIKIETKSEVIEGKTPDIQEYKQTIPTLPKVTDWANHNIQGVAITPETVARN